MATVEISDEDRAIALFDAITRSARRLAQVSPMATAAVDVLEEICRAAGVQRGLVFENVEDGDGLSGIEVARWSEPGYEPQVSMIQRGHPYAQWRHCYASLVDERGVVSGPSERVLSPEREQLEALGVRSVLAVPIFAGRRWWGFLGLHDCVEAREWGPLERRAMVCAAAVLGAAAYERPPSQDEGALQRLVEQVPAILYIDDLEVRHRSIYVGPQIESILGIPRASWLDDDGGWERNMHPDDWPRVNREHEKWLQQGGGNLVQVYRMVRPDDGRVVWIQDECATYPGADGSLGVIQGVMIDITGQKVLEDQLRASEAKNRSLIEQIPAVVYIEPLPGSTEARFVSATVETVFGVSRDEWLTTDWWLWHLHPDDRERVLAFRRSLPDHDEPVRAEYRVVAWDGTVVWIGEIARVVSHDGRPQVVQGLMEDVTKRREAEEQVKFLAYHDALTGLSNRVMFEEHLELAMARAERTGGAVAVLYVDLDGLKRVNDTLGHQAGDQLLAAAASRLRHATRAVDLVARHGGDEFLVMLPDLARGADGDAGVAGGEIRAGEERPPATARAIAERICRIVREPVPIGGTEVVVTASVGISLFPDDAADTRTLLKHADEAMYQSKQKEPGRVRLHGDTP